MHRPYVYERSAPRRPREAYQEATLAGRAPVIVPAVDVLRALLDRVEVASGADAILDRDILSALHLQEHMITGAGAARPTNSLDGAVALIRRVLLGWAWSCGSWVVSNNAWLKPDSVGPDAHFCDGFDEGFCGDTEGGNVLLSQLSAMFQGLIAKAEVAGQSSGEVAAAAL